MKPETIKRRTKQRRLVFEALGKYGGPAGVSDLVTALSPEVPAHAVRRALAELVAAGRATGTWAYRFHEYRDTWGHDQRSMHRLTLYSRVKTAGSPPP